MDSEKRAVRADEPASGPLLGLKVVDFSRGMPGAMATMLFADYGADVVKVEHPLGDPFAAEAAYCVWNRGKKTWASGEPGKSWCLHEGVCR